MSNVTIDLSDYKDTVGGRVEAGRYKVLVEDADLDRSKAGNTMIVLGLKIIAPGSEADGVTLVDRLTQTSGALFRTVNFMQALGLPTPRKRLSINLSKFTGKMLMVDVEDGEPYQGRVKSEVRGYFKAVKASADDAAEEDLDDVEDIEEEDIEETVVEETPAPKKTKAKKAKAKKVEPEPEPDEDEDDEDEDDTLDLDDLDVS